MKNTIKDIFFDLDNTLWDTDRNSKLALEKMFKDKQVYENYGIEFSDFYKKYYVRNEHLWALYRQDKVTKHDIISLRFHDTFKEFEVDNEEISQYFEANFINKVTENNNLVDNVEESLKYLKDKGYRLHVVSNGFIEPTERKVYGTPIKNYITTLTSGEEINKRKPAKEVFELGLKKANAKWEESSFIGDDWEADVMGSKKLGMFPVFFDYKKEGKYLQNGFPIIKDLIELKNIF